MNATQRLLVVMALATTSAFSAHADEADESQYVIQVQSTRSAADVRAEARNPVRITNGSTGVMGMTESRATRQAISQEAAQQARAGNTARGEFGSM